MGRKSHRQQLNVWMNGLLVGEWTLAHGEEIFAYHASWLNHPQTRPLSLSLPFLPNNAAHRGAVVNAYFDNLLPDSDIIRRRLAQHHRLSDSAPFTLLAALGRDCVGALQLLPEDETPQNLQCIIGEPLDDAAIAALLQQTVQPGLPGQRNSDADLRLSIAGAQEKTALLQHAGRWQRPLGSTPTTHIFKLPLGLVGGMQADMRSSVENEWLCAQLVAAFGLPVARCDIAHFEAQKVLVVERFDRRLSSDGRWLMRLPQEDLCQATATPPYLKYQADGGPGIARILDILAGSENSETDRRQFFKAQVVFWLLAATDGHAKNFSLFHLPGGRYRATPLYDILSAHPVIGHGAGKVAPQKAKLAMAVRGQSNHYLIERIQPRHWLAQARSSGLTEAWADELLNELADNTGEILQKIEGELPPDFPADVAETIFHGIRRQREKLTARLR
ncbi:MAG: type II toxin-antitoxin system HipA family toxin [Rivihabitans pingtungensis]|mgnify:CR=1 FL=1|jgi:serine/threonine-protein kinase HipA|uniref:type II toxin-antitoxin system HipA family toxin n=1 Tax=Rivihabitans pingtungensis TaxID=1054498 RepID=UPI0023537AE8|nr:type II toxin-antitoxin system HipA family toxin [Rivihabitans pingtungensis]MCK6438207.1 type II toxin-antitoxin system HipA family toxin [Rivihabitans pingtungensis]HNX72080.1 type II toxin-antitoxin system HipA family toxin [Rivihabitans pingtungensis]